MQKLNTGFQRVEQPEIRLKGVRDIVFLGDVGCTPFVQANEEVFGKILEIAADIFVVLGDITFLGDSDEFEQIIGFCKGRAPAPVFSLCGNHDLGNYSEFLGRATYALILDSHVIVALDNSKGRFLDESLKFLTETLKRHADKRFVITFHIPPPTDLLAMGMKQDEWGRLREITDPHRERIDCMLSGHIHAFQEYHLDGYRIFISGGGGAALYDLEKDALKSHHAIKVVLESSKLRADVIPIKTDQNA
jgi:3',5'-cyclic AMP phosphodiesterase CpdA